MITVNDIKTALAPQTHRATRKKVSIEKTAFYAAMTYFGNQIFVRRMEFENGVHKKFKIDSGNENVINMFHSWITCENFNGNLMRGIALTGGYGTGKTVIIESFCSVFEFLTGLKGQSQRIEIIVSDKLNDRIKQMGLDYFKTRPIFIDEIGREEVIYSDYGNKSYPIIELLHMREDHGAITFATANITKETLCKNYDGLIGDRLPGMFNFIELVGESRRVK